MIIQALVDYYEALSRKGKIPRLGWCFEKAAFALVISTDGRLIELIPQVHVEPRGKKTVEMPDVFQVPERQIRSSGIRANFLCDNTAYLLGLGEKSKPHRSKDCFEAAKQLHLEILGSVDSDAARAVVAFFSAWVVADAQAHEAIAPHHKDLLLSNLVFKLERGCYAHDDPAIQAASQAHSDATPASEHRRCSITGQVVPIASLHGKVKGVDGAQSAGANLISCNAKAFESYDIVEAPVSEYAAFAYVTALNHLLSDREHKRKIGDTTVVYWSEDGEEAPRETFSLFADPTPDDAELLTGAMDRLASGLPIDDVQLGQHFYVLGLSPNSARLSVRFFLTDTFGHMLRHFREHYERMEIIAPPRAPEYVPVSMLLSEVATPGSKDKSSSPLLAGEVMRAIIDGTRYPQSLYQAVLVRIKAEADNADKQAYKITRGRATIIKAVLLQTLPEPKKEVLTVPLNETSTERAYVLGRLFAELERAQQEANPGVHATIKDRYFTAACTTPGTVFPRLLQLANHHNAKSQHGDLREHNIQQLIDKLDVEPKPFPVHQSLEDQGLFILGYYHQTQTRYVKKEV